MSRNKERIYAQEPTVPQAPPPNLTQDNPFGLSFVVPIESVQLPSGGHLYPEDGPLYGQEQLEIRHMTSKEEDLLTNESFVRDGSVLDRLLDSLLVREDVKASLLTPGDKEALLYAARITGYGPEYRTQEICEDCGEVAEFVFDLNKREIETRDLPEEVVYDTQSKLYTFKLPKTGIEVAIKILMTSELESLDEHKKQKEKLNLPFSRTAEFLRMAIVSAAGIVDRSAINKLVNVLPTIDARKIKMIHSQATPKLNTLQEVKCGQCGLETEREVPYSLGFFWPDI